MYLQTVNIIIMKRHLLFGLLALMSACIIVSCEKESENQPTDDPIDNPNENPNDDPSQKPGQETEVQSISYMDAVGTYYGSDTQAGISVFQIQLSPTSLMDMELPLHYLYLQLIANPVTDVENLRLEAGEYNILEGDVPTPMTFYPGAEMDDGYGGSLIFEVSETQEETIRMIIDGTINIAVNGDVYDISGRITLTNKTVIELSYSGPILIRNQSSEGQKPADEVELPISTLTSDVVVEPIECYMCIWSQFFYEYPNFDYVYILLYEDRNYANLLQISLLVDREKYPNDVIPAGNYPMMDRYPSEFESMPISSVASFRITTDVDPFIDYGCIYQQNYVEFHPLVDGNVVVNSYDPETRVIDMSYALTTNGETPVEVSGQYNGVLLDLNQ